MELPLAFQAPSLCLQNQNCQFSDWLPLATSAFTNLQVLADFVCVVCNGVKTTLMVLEATVLELLQDFATPS